MAGGGGGIPSTPITIPAAAPALGPLRSAVTAPLVVEPPPCSSPRPVGGVGCGVVSGKARVGRSPPLGLEPTTPVGVGAAEADERGAVTKKSAGVGVMAVTGPLEDVPIRPLGPADPPRAGAAVADGDDDVTEDDLLASFSESSESESEGFPDSIPSESEADVSASSSAAPSVDEGRPAAPDAPAAAPVPGGVAARLDGGKTTTPSPDPTPEPRRTALVAVATGTAARDDAARDAVARDGVALGGAANPAPVPPVPAPTDATPAPGSRAGEGVWAAAGAGRVALNGMSSSESLPLSRPSSPEASPEWSSPEWFSSRVMSDLRVTLLRVVVLGWGKSSLSDPSVSKPSVSVSSPRWACRRASHLWLLNFWA